ncbi:MAG: hypothetical protein ACOX9R_03020 [Armatimonadota bacterium]
MRAQLIAASVAALLVLCITASFGQGWDAGDTLWDARSVAATQTQSWFGGTGMIVIPTAYAVPQGSITAHYHTIDISSADDWQDVWGLSAGIYSGFEAGITHLERGFTGTGSNELVYQAKFAQSLNDLLRLGPEAPNIAIGGRDLSDRINDTYYMVLSKDFDIDEHGGHKVGVSLGVGNSSGSGVPLDGFFIGVDFTPFDFARLQIEHDSENLNAALRYWWSEWAVTEIGVLDGDIGFGASVYTGW